MNNKCNIVQDLLPLCVENIASADSEAFVKEHLKTSSTCRAEYKCMKNGTAFEIPQEIVVEEKLKKRSFQNAKRKLTRHAQLVSFVLVFIGLAIGLSLTSGIEMFLNAWIMPVIGVLGYFVFKWKAIYKISALLVVMGLVINFINFFLQAYGFPSNYIEFSGFALYTLIYIVFMWAGIIIAGLLHFAFSKEE